MNIRLALPIVFAFAFPNFVLPVQAQVVPGTGQLIVEAFDDFEDPNWNFTLNLPKSSANIDKTERHPSGFAANRLYLESLYRGTPDSVKRIETPEGGIRGSKGSLAMQTLNSGVPGQVSKTFQQDDLIAGVQQKLGYMMPVGWTPSYTCRVYVPPFEQWERRHGSHFGFRADCNTTITKKTSMGKFFKNVGSYKALEQYWPGFFLQLNLKNMTHQPEDYAQIVMRGDELGHEIPGPKITHAGWWTLGMSFTPDGKVHYYAREGVGDLTARDHLHSGFPYGYKCEQTSTFFFNIVNQDDGRTWSTRWIVDDAKAFVATGSYRPPVQQVAQAPQQTAQKPPAAVQSQTAVAPSSIPVLPPQLPATPPQTLTARPVQPNVPAVAVSTLPPVTAPVPPKAATPIVVTPVVTIIPLKTAVVPLTPILKVASKPNEISAVVPKAEQTTETAGPAPALISAPTLDSKPAPTSPVIEEPSVPVTAPKLEVSPVVESPASPPPPSIPE